MRDYFDQETLFDLNRKLDMINVLDRDSLLNCISDIVYSHENDEYLDKLSELEYDLEQAKEDYKLAELTIEDQEEKIAELEDAESKFKNCIKKIEDSLGSVKCFC